MKVALMQPYMFPYLGYFQLINSVDCFIVYDNVQFMKGGWVNRNRILYKDEAYMFTLGVKKDSYKLDINNRFYSEKFEMDKEKLYRVLSDSYSSAPFFAEVRSLIIDILESNERNVALLNTRCLEKVFKYLGIRKSFLLSSQVSESNVSVHGQERVIQIVKQVGGSTYINPIGGNDLYSKDIFSNENIELCFLKMKDIRYMQFNDRFIPSLSIIDVLMFNSRETVIKMLEEYELT